MHHLSISVSTDPTVQHQIDSQSESRQIQVPAKDETLRLLQVYFDYIGYFQHIIYQPHALDVIDEVYDEIAHVSTTTAPRGLALILGIVAMGIVLEPLQGISMKSFRFSKSGSGLPLSTSEPQWTAWNSIAGEEATLLKLCRLCLFSNFSSAILKRFHLQVDTAPC